MESLTRYKSMAKAMRHALAERGMYLSHSDCLEIVASQAGFSDWNVLKAACDSDLSLSLTIFIEHGRQAEAVRFYEDAFDTSSTAIYSPDNLWVGFDLRVGETVISIAGANPRREAEPWRGGPFFPKERGAVNVILRLAVNNVEDVLRRAIVAGATVRDKPQSSIEGVRGATFFDPFGHIWAVTERSPSHWSDAEHRSQRYRTRKAEQQSRAGLAARLPARARHCPKRQAGSNARRIR
ncbi:MAG: hypothetical protein NTAFB05_18700 [Nitrobacter sp.]|uniref:glyoxalase superfamily protein n=1 Tax=Nitrobacter sp. TaxID=29420 RepID=UPI00387DD8E0